MAQGNGSHAIASPGTYVGVFLALMVLTALTVAVAWVDLGLLNTPVALAIAGAKAALVVWFFMEVRHAHPVTKLVMLSAVVWLVILGALTFSDYMSRSWLYRPQSW